MTDEPSKDAAAETNDEGTSVEGSPSGADKGEGAPSDRDIRDDERDLAVEAKDPAPPPEGGPDVPERSDELTSDALFEALWTRVLDSWDDDKPHVAILEHALRTEMLPELAGRYRKQKDVQGHEERAKKKLDAIVIAATQMLMAMKTEKPEKAPWQLTAGVAVVCVLVLVWVAFKILKPH